MPSVWQLPSWPTWHRMAPVNVAGESWFVVVGDQERQVLNMGAVLMLYTSSLERSGV